MAGRELERVLSYLNFRMFTLIAGGHETGRGREVLRGLVVDWESDGVT